jgi:hypothetical protein
MTTSISGRPFMTPVFRQPGAPWPRTTARPEPSGMERRYAATSAAPDWGSPSRAIPPACNPLEWPRLGIETTCNVATFSAMAWLIWFGYLTGGGR